MTNLDKSLLNSSSKGYPSMKILIVAATKPEIALLADHFNLQGEDFIQSDKFDVLITGVGMTATAFSLGQHLPGSYHLILNLGIAGSFDRALTLGTVVNIVEDEFSDLGAEDGGKFIAIDELGFGSSKYVVKYPLTLDSVKDLRRCNGITVNTVHGNETSIKNIVERLRPTTESMEGAAVLYSCEKLSLPCLQIRSISNYVEVRNRDNWKIALAIGNLNKWAIDFLTNA